MSKSFWNLHVIFWNEDHILKFNYFIQCIYIDELGAANFCIFLLRREQNKNKNKKLDEVLKISGQKNNLLKGDYNELDISQVGNKYRNLSNKFCN